MVLRSVVTVLGAFAPEPVERLPAGARRRGRYWPCRSPHQRVENTRARPKQRYPLQRHRGAARRVGLEARACRSAIGSTRPRQPPDRQQRQAPARARSSMVSTSTVVPVVYLPAADHSPVCTRCSRCSSSTNTGTMLSSARCFLKNVLHVVHEPLDTPRQRTLGQGAPHAPIGVAQRCV